MNSIKTVFFDLDETLVENRMSISDVFAHMYIDFLEELGNDKQTQFFNALREQAGQLWANMFNEVETPERQLIGCFARSIDATGNVPKDRQLNLAQEMFEHFIYMSSNNVKFNYKALEVLRELRERGIRIGIITNGIEQVQSGKTDILGLENYVDNITISAQARAHKPLKAVFDLALNRLDAQPQTSLMVGDHPLNDVAGGIRAGMSGVYFNPKGHELEVAFADIIERPCHTIKTLPDVLNLVS